MKNTNTSAIRTFRGENGFLSNMISCPVTVGGLTYRCAEAAFQAQKTMDLEKRAYFTEMDGSRAKKWGKKVALRSDWEQAKVGIMYDVVLAKFTQNEALGKQLVATGDAELIEGNTWGDTFWGVDSTKGGRNELGKILMAVRDVLKASAHVETLKEVDAAKAAAEAANIAAWKKAHNEGEQGAKPTCVNSSAINAPATATAVKLDAEREDSKFDYRRAEDILSQSEADTYEETDSLLDEDVKDLRGHHKAVLVSWENVKGRVEIAKDGSQRFYKPYVLLTFSVDGELVPSRAYTKQWESFKIQANQKFHGLFNYMKSSKALDELVSAEFDIWLKWNELFYNRETNTQGEWQADFYDAAAYRARKAERAKAGFVRGGYGRPTENKATR